MNQCPLCLSYNVEQDVGELFCFDCNYYNQEQQSDRVQKIVHAYKKYQRCNALIEDFSQHESSYRLAGLSIIYNIKLIKYVEESNKAVNYSTLMLSHRERASFPSKGQF